MWPDGGLGEDRPPQQEAILAPLEAVAAQLRRVHEDLIAFMDAAGRWAQDVAPDMASEVAAKLDESFAIMGDVEPSPQNTP